MDIFFIDITAGNYVVAWQVSPPGKYNESYSIRGRMHSCARQRNYHLLFSVIGRLLGLLKFQCMFRFVFCLRDKTLACRLVTVMDLIICNTFIISWVHCAHLRCLSLRDDWRLLSTCHQWSFGKTNSIMDSVGISVAWLLKSDGHCFWDAVEARRTCEEIQWRNGR